jgi:conjugal transfer ATP-binding protein TraC
MNRASQAAYENSDFNIILAQTPESIEQLVASKRIVIDANLQKLMTSLSSTSEYSEMLIKSAQGYSIHRLILDPFSRILFSSKGEEFAAVKRLEAQDIPLKDAIRTVAAKFNHKR